MPITLDSTLSPGVYVSELTANRAVNLVTPSIAYMLGTSSNIVDQNKAVIVPSLAEFVLKFPASPSAVYAENYFAQTKQPFYFINIAQAGTSPILAEVVLALGALSDKLETGAIFAPELFADTLRVDSVAVATAIGTKASELQWVCFIDTPYTARATVGTDDITAGSVRAFAAGLGVAAKPSSHVIFPWVKTSAGVEVAPSGHIVGMCIYVWTKAGFAQPPAGIAYPLNNVSDTVLPINKAVQDILNPKNINCIRYFRSAPGYVLYGSRMLDGTFLNSRVILNVISATMSDAIQQLVFSNIDSQGLLFVRARELAESVLYRVWLQGGLAGNTPQDAFAVVCDASNNTPVSLQAGKLVLDIYVSPSSTVEVVLVVPHRVAIGGLTDELANLRP